MYMPENIKSQNKTRILSIDALRGFDMFWIIGGSSLAVALLTVKENSWISRFASEFSHSSWNGFTFYDLIFPLFLFVVGLTVPFSIAKYITGKKDLKGAYIRIVKRFFLLFLLGLIVNGLLDFNFSEMRWPGVLQRIAICYLFSAITELHASKKYKPVIIACVVAALLFGYWLVMKFIPVPGFGAGNLGPQRKPGRIY